jgi:ribosomal silencing factor RsfS
MNNASMGGLRSAGKALLDGLYNEVRAQRFSKIVVIQTKFDTGPKYYILANAFNSRHLLNGTEMINKHYKRYLKSEGQEFADLSISKEWNVLDFHLVVIHLFSDTCRERYNIDELWAVGEKYDGLLKTINHQ